MAGRLNLRLPNGQTASIGLSDAALDYLGCGPEGVFDGENFLVSARGVSVDSPNTDKPGRVTYVRDPIGQFTWTQWLAEFRARINIDPGVSAFGGDLALAAIAGWEKLQTQFVTSVRSGRPPKTLQRWSIRDEILGAIQVRVLEGLRVLPAIRAVQSANPDHFRKAFPGGTDAQRMTAAKRAYYRAIRNMRP
jgi:hypothetical protein